MRFLFTLCIGIAATLAWQTYGDQAREMIAGTYPQLAWLSPRAAAPIVPMASAAPVRSADPQLQEVTLGLSAIRQRVDQLALQLSTSQDQMARDIAAKVQAAERDILEKIAAGQPKIAAAQPKQEVAAARRPAPSPSQSTLR